MKRITITGNAGSGKSYLSIELAKMLNLPIYHLDKYYWKPNWIKGDPEEFLEKLYELCDKEEWIIEGSYIRFLEPRFFHADTIIFLDLPRWLCLYQVFKRLILHRGNVTATAPLECPERFSFEFIRWVWNFKKRNNKYITILLDTYSESKKIYILRSKKDIQTFLDFLKNKTV